MIIEKKIYYSGILLILIIAAMLLSHLLQNSKEKRSHAPFYPNFVRDFEELTLTKADESVTLLKRDGKWLVSGGTIAYEADSVKIISLITKIQEMKGDIFVGKSRNNDLEYGLAGDSAFFVQAKDAEFTLGKRSENWRHNYFRRNNDDNIYLVGGGIGFAFKTDINEWRSKILFDFNPDDINDIVSGEFRLTKEDGKWILNESLEANPDSVAKFLKDISELDAGNWDYTYSIPDEVSGLNNPTQKIVLNQEYSLIIGNIDGERPRYFVRVNDGEQIVYIFKSQAERLILTHERLTNTNEQSAEIMRTLIEEFQSRQQ